MSYNSKYTGQQVEALLDIVSQGGGTGGEGGEVQKTTEAEILAMGFTKNEGTITEVKMNGVSKGTSGVVDLGTVITEHQDISGKVDKVTGKQLSTEDFTTALKQKLECLSNYNDTEINAAVSSLQTQLNTLVSGNANDAINSFNEIIAFLDGIKDNQDLSSIIASIEQQIASKMDKVTLANVATSGSYNDLKDKPTIPSAVTESIVSGWGFTKNAGTYSKPSTGIPKSDLASEVQTSLGKADTALQSVPSEYVTETELTSKGYATNTALQIAMRSTEMKLSELELSLDGKQPVLVSGTNIKTINGTSILGSGNITISGGGSSGGGSGAYAEVNHGTSDTTFTLTPNTFHVWDEVASLDLSLGSEQAGVANEFLFQFTSGATPTTLTLPDSIKWANGNEPSIAENKIYQISVLKGLGMVLEFENAPELIENKATINGDTVVFEYPVASNVEVLLFDTSAYFSEGDIVASYDIPLGSDVSMMYITSILPPFDDVYKYIY